jgi:hypothetical protein
LDEAGKLQMLHGEDARRLTFGEKSWMLSDFIKDLTPQELTDMVAFLSRQSVRGSDMQKGTSAPKEGAQ